MRKALVVSFVASFVALVACGGGKGDSCDEEGKSGGECDEGFVCGKAKNESTGELVCLTQCSTQLNCAANEDCLGVGKTSLKGCRPR
jgi:hypothetical protein